MPDLAPERRTPTRQSEPNGFGSGRCETDGSAVDVGTVALGEASCGATGGLYDGECLPVGPTDESLQAPSDRCTAAWTVRHDIRRRVFRKEAESWLLSLPDEMRSS